MLTPRASQVAMTWRGLRQQTEKQHASMASCALAAAWPTSSRRKALRATTMWACSPSPQALAPISAPPRFEAAHDDYSAIMLKSLADRLAEALAECLHKKVRTDLWGYAPAESLSNEALIAEQYQGIRPAPGYPACPDHSAKKALFALLQCEDIGMGLTESLAMTPAASVSGFYLAHPEAQYFSVGKVGDDQVADLAQRSAVQVKDLQRLLAPNL